MMTLNELIEKLQAIAAQSPDASEVLWVGMTPIAGELILDIQIKCPITSITLD